MKMQIVGVIVAWPDGTKVELFRGGWRVIEGSIEYGTEKWRELHTIRFSDSTVVAWEDQ